MFIQKPKKEYIDEAGVKVQKWLTTHNLPHWSPLVVWFIITLPSIATAYFKLPLAIVLLLSFPGFGGLFWVVYFRNNSSEDYVPKRVVKAEVPEVELCRSDTPPATDEQQQVREIDRSAEESNKLSQAQTLASTLLGNISTQVSLEDWPISEVDQSIEKIVDSDCISEAMQESGEVISDFVDETEADAVEEPSDFAEQDTTFYDDLVEEQDNRIDPIDEEINP
jgi:hypothetical protein